MWISDIGILVYARVKDIGISKLKSTYPNIYFTDETPKDTPKKFPTVVIKKMQGGENNRSKDLERRKVNGIISTFQIEVISNESQLDSDYIGDVCCEIMKDMMYDMVGEPFQDNSRVDYYRNVARYQRNLDYGDKL